MRLVGYSNRLSVAPGESIAFMVSSAHPAYDAEIVRLVHGDPNSLGPGIIEQVVDTPVNGRYEGRIQSIHTGSNITVEEGPSLRITGSFRSRLGSPDDTWQGGTGTCHQVVTRGPRGLRPGYQRRRSGPLARGRDGARSARWRRRPPAGANLVLHRRDLRCRDG